ncbi:MAG: hypothetical protein WD360_02335 [Nitriliruptoraceae bacterium]
MTEQLRRCDACAAPVFAERVLCPQCGRDLDELDAPLAWPYAHTPFEPQAPPVRKRAVRRVIVLLLLIAFVAAGVVIARLLVTNEEDPLVMPAAQRELASETARSISEIGTLGAGDDPDALGNARAMVDGDSSTAWFGEAPTLGFVGREQILLRLDQPAWVSRLVIANGVHASLDTYDAHGRMRTVELTFDGGITRTVSLLDIGRISQQIMLPEPTLTTSLKLTVLAVYPGQQVRDVAVTTLEVRGYNPNPTQKQLAEQRAEDLPAVEAVAPR